MNDHQNESDPNMQWPKKRKRKEKKKDKIRNAKVKDSPADLHGMWYPTVRRTLVCLSRLYRCVDRPIFQGLSQEALTMCIQSVASAAQAISAKKSPIDGELFQIKHLLILREQIAPFQVDFTIKEMSLDFSKVKTAAFGLLHKRKRLFSLGTNNALLEFLLEGTPTVREQLVDSRKEVDKQLKSSCEAFIQHATKSLATPLLAFLDKGQVFVSMQTEVGGNVTLAQQPFARADIIGQIVQETQRLIKNKLPVIQRSMQLYLANRETEFILFRPIKDGSQCRHCTEIETLPHVLGFCQHGTLIRNTRHHAIRELIAKSLPSFYEVHQEVHCLAKDGSSRRVDIIAIDIRNDRAIIIDPTVRFGTAVEQPAAVHEEKKTIYDPRIQYFRDYYHI
ncbi:hypothetical protein ANN_08839 [Periplaneta americana]|uniref:Conserved oligomeric Golgi complex subunit 3 C-terminal domain-containing protein n=1 Tax=Periplaneta americana TaxID=6978 RepID=A0ABQ8T3Q2_PERAM|nr:hypothetical protein ANN_08839 [Periplaneta americana]